MILFRCLIPLKTQNKPQQFLNELSTAPTEQSYLSAKHPLSNYLILILIYNQSEGDIPGEVERNMVYIANGPDVYRKLYVINEKWVVDIWRVLNRWYHLPWTLAGYQTTRISSFAFQFKILLSLHIYLHGTSFPPVKARSNSCWYLLVTGDRHWWRL